MPSLLQHKPCHIEQSVTTIQWRNWKGGNRGEKQGRDTMLDFAFHFPLKLEFLYCRLSPHTINANGTIDNGVGV